MSANTEPPSRYALMIWSRSKGTLGGSRMRSPLLHVLRGPPPPPPPPAGSPPPPPAVGAWPGSTFTLTRRGDDAARDGAGVDFARFFSRGGDAEPPARVRLLPTPVSIKVSSPCWQSSHRDRSESIADRHWRHTFFSSCSLLLALLSNMSSSFPFDIPGLLSIPLATSICLIICTERTEFLILDAAGGPPARRGSVTLGERRASHG